MSLFEESSRISRQHDPVTGDLRRHYASVDADDEESDARNLWFDGADSWSDIIGHDGITQILNDIKDGYQLTGNGPLFARSSPEEYVKLLRQRLLEMIDEGWEREKKERRQSCEDSRPYRH